MRGVGIFLLALTCVLTFICVLDWFGVILKGGSVGVGTSALASANFSMVIAFAALAIAFMVGANQQWSVIKPLKKKDLKECPSCAEQIRKKASVCRYCGHDVPVGETLEPAGPPKFANESDSEYAVRVRRMQGYLD